MEYDAEDLDGLEVSFERLYLDVMSILTNLSRHIVGCALGYMFVDLLIDAMFDRNQ